MEKDKREKNNIYQHIVLFLVVKRGSPKEISLLNVRKTEVGLKTIRCVDWWPDAAAAAAAARDSNNTSSKNKFDSRSLKSAAAAPPFYFFLRKIRAPQYILSVVASGFRMRCNLEQMYEKVLGLERGENPMKNKRKKKNSGKKQHVRLVISMACLRKGQKGKWKNFFRELKLGKRLMVLKKKKNCGEGKIREGKRPFFFF